MLSWIKENRRAGLYTLALRCLCVFITLQPVGPVRADDVTAPDASRRAELVQLLRHDCGSCHGLTLKGGLGPPLTPTALAGKPPEWLRATILDGRPGTPMPPWRPFMTEQEAGWLVDLLIRGLIDAEK